MAEVALQNRSCSEKCSLSVLLFFFADVMNVLNFMCQISNRILGLWLVRKRLSLNPFYFKSKQSLTQSILKENKTTAEL